ncbi:MAG: sulfur carrier protein ThiS [Thermoanaerobaculia bacterium]
MRVFVNEQPHFVSDEATLHDLLEDLGLASRRGIAVALQDRVIPQFAWKECVLQSDSSVLIIAATQGG